MNTSNKDERRAKADARLDRIMKVPLPDGWWTQNVPLSTQQVLKILGGRTPQHLCRMVNQGTFPPPFKVSLRRNAWWSQDVVKYFSHLKALPLAHQRSTPKGATERLKDALQQELAEKLSETQHV